LHAGTKQEISAHVENKYEEKLNNVLTSPVLLEAYQMSDT
jgi:hypothetical protein